MKAKLKAPRRGSNKKDDAAAILVLKKLVLLLKLAVWLESTAPNPAKQGLKYWCHSGNENWFKND